MVAAAGAAVLAASLTAAVSTAAAPRDGQLRVSASGLHASAASVQLQGGSASGGKWFGWVVTTWHSGFFSVARLRPDGQWRLLQTTGAP